MLWRGVRLRPKPFFASGEFWLGVVATFIGLALLFSLAMRFASWL